MLALTAFVLVISSLLNAQNRHNDSLRTKIDRINNYRKISETSGACGYKYFHGPAIELNRSYETPSEASENILTLGEGSKESSSASFSPSVTPGEDRITCESTRTWYLGKDK